MFSFVINNSNARRSPQPNCLSAEQNDVEEQEEFQDEKIDDLAVPNKYYKRSKYSKVGFKHGLKKMIETQEERLARTFNIMAPFPKEALAHMTDKKYAQNPELLTNTDKYIENKIAAEKMSTADKQGTSKEVYVGKLKTKSSNQAISNTNVRCPNAILIDKSMIFATPLDEYIVVGKILRPHGLKGHVKVISLCSNPEIRLCEPGYRFLKFQNRDETVMPIKIEYGRLFDGLKTYRLKLEGIDTRDQAFRLNGAYLSVSIRDVPPLEEDCYYSRDLLTLDVYLFNDEKKTKLGKVVDFRHREDLVSMPKLANLTEDLIEVEMDIKLSLKTLLDLTRSAREPSVPQQSEILLPKRKGVSVVTDRDLENADEIIDAEEELINSSMTGVHYVKYYVCSICNKEFTNYTTALEHDKAHQAGAIPAITESQERSPIESGNSDERVYTLDEYYERNIKRPIRRFYIPLIKDETIKLVDIPNKSIYVDAYTIFIGEDGNMNHRLG